MNDSHLENLLRSLHPVAPAPELAQRIQHDLDLMAAFREAVPPVVVSQPRRHALWLANLVWAGLGAAAAVVAMNVMHSSSSSATARVAVVAPAVVPALSSSAASGVIMPVNSTREWVDVEDQGITFATPDSPARQMKVTSVERHQWIDPRDGAEYTVEVPQEESVVLPMKFQ